MKTLLKVFGLLVVLLVAVALLAPMFVSMDDITDTIAGQVQETTGRTLVIEGDKSLSVFPSLALQLKQVRLSNKVGGSRPDMATIESLDVHIPWMSLFSKQLSVDKFVINNPDILLEIDAAGNPNWDLMSSSEVAPETTTVEANENTTSLPAGFDVSLGEVAIYGGSIRFIDHREGTEQSAQELDLALSLPSLKKDLALKGAITWMGEVLQLNVVLTTPAALLDGKPFDVELAVDSRLVKMSYRGNVKEGGARVQGSMELAGDSVKELAAWQGFDLQGSGNAYSNFTLLGEVLFTGDTLQISGLEAKMDALAINGETSIRLTDTPVVNADIDLGMLDLNPYLPAVVTAEEKPAKSTENSKAQAVEWDDAPLDLSALSSVNGKINLRSSSLKFRDIKLGENALKLTLQAGELNVDLEKFAAYEGQGKGNITLDARRKPYKAATNFSLTGVSAQPLLTDIVGFDKLLGNGQLQWQLRTSGTSQKDFVGQLNGSLGFEFLDGAVKGANIAAMVRTGQSLLEGDASGLGRLAQGYDEAEQTDFSELAGTLAFSKGVGSNKDLAMASPLLRVSGEGKINLPKTYIDYALNVRLVSSIEGQGAVEETKGIAVPVRIKGPFHKVKIELDTKQAVEEKVKNTLKSELLKRFGKKG